ncbi:MAG: hypothetical protein AAF206_21160, partial [Bacteroidota bacterium]
PNSLAMKQTFTLVFLCLMTLHLSAQNHLFIPFGQSEEDVKQYLQTRDYIVQVVEDKEVHSLRAEIDQHKHVEYAFDDGALYATTVTRAYETRRTAQSVLKNCLNYLRSISRADINETTSDNVTVYTTATEHRIIKLFVTSHKRGQTLSLTSVSRHYGPMDQEQDFMYEVELLQRKFISN